jgi:F-type H+-transporting ATPase subunit c
MKKAAVLVIAFIAVLAIAPSAFAQGGAAEKVPPVNTSTLALAVGFGLAIAAFGGALGQGRIASAACEAIARNPGAAGNIRPAMLLGLVFVETLSLFTFVLGILLYFKF